MKLWVALAVTGALGFAVWAAEQKPANPPVAAQAPAAQSDEYARITIDVTRVSLLFTVTDKKRRFVTDLRKEDFEVVEGKKRQDIQEFAAESDLPLRLGILVDTSNSIRDRFRFEQEAATDFIKSVVHPRVDKAMLVSFDTQAELRSDLVDDPTKVADAINELRPGGGTALYDAIYFACRDKLAQDQPMHKFRRAIILLSDGEDNQSRYTRDQAIEMAQKADTIIYAISTNISRSDTAGDRVLKYFTEETGGRSFFPFKVEDLETSFVEIANELRHQYNISYRPEPLVTDGLFHPIDLKVKGRKDLIVNVRKGYYARKM
jgi:Ca-activated chloride channel homolog